jgi:prepilin-type N-terminal cleavage/methylation domain-containing protein
MMKRNFNARRSAGFTFTEIMLVVAMMGILVAIAQPRFSAYLDNQSVRAAGRASVTAFQLARSESIKRSENILVVFIGATEDPTPDELSKIGDDFISEPILIVEDADQDCMIDAGEIIYDFDAAPGIVWGTTSSLAGSTAASTDQGVGTANVSHGSSLTDASLSAANPASWVLFRNDGLPRAFTTTDDGGCASISEPARGAGAIYLTNGLRDYAIVLSPLGQARLQVWDAESGDWNR